LLFVAGWILLVPCSAPVRADLDGFRKDVDLEEQSGKPVKNGSNTGDTNSGCLGNCCAPFFNVFWRISGDLWVINNLSVVYRDHPYAAGAPHFVDFQENAGTNDAVEGRPGYYRFSAGFRWAGDEGAGVEASLRGRVWKFFGPEFCLWSLWDGRDFLLHGGLGLNLAVFQADPLSCDLYCQYSFFEGILRRKGVAAGAVFTSYPVKPLVVELKLGARVYGKIAFVDVDLSAGVMIGRHELYASFNLLDSGRARITGAGVGFRSYY
jgi:hypothetical protein